MNGEAISHTSGFFTLIQELRIKNFQPPERKGKHIKDIQKGYLIINSCKAIDTPFHRQIQLDANGRTYMIEGRWTAIGAGPKLTHKQLLGLLFRQLYVLLPHWYYNMCIILHIIIHHIHTL